MAMTIESAKRVFKFGDIELPDPGNDMEVEDVLSFYSDAHPSLVNAQFTGPEVDDDGNAVYMIAEHIGKKG